MGVSKNNGTPKLSILIGISIINHPFWGTPIFGNTHIGEDEASILGTVQKVWWSGWCAMAEVNLFSESLGPSLKLTAKAPENGGPLEKEIPIGNQHF